MKSHYDKLILAFGVIALIAGGAFYFLKSGQASTDVEQLMQQSPSGSAYKAVKAPSVEVEVAVWRDPKAQDAAGLELYDIFTPPKIFWNPLENRLTFEPPVPPPPPTPFGLGLVNIEREMFRIQLEAYFGDPNSNSADTLIQFYNTRIGESVRGKVGDSFPEHGFRIKSFRVERSVEESEGSTVLRRIPTAVIVDIENDNREIALTTDSRLFIEGKVEIHMKTEDPYPPEQFTWTQEGDTYTVDDAVFTLQEFNFDNQTVRVEKRAPYLESPATRTLSKLSTVSNPSATSKTPEGPLSSDRNEPSPFDSLFN